AITGEVMAPAPPFRTIGVEVEDRDHEGRQDEGAVVRRGPPALAPGAPHEPADPRDRGRDLLPASELPRDRPGPAGASQGAAAGRRARGAAPRAERAPARRGIRAGPSRDRAGRAGARPGAPRARLHAHPAGAVSSARRRPSLEPRDAERRRTP